MPGDGASCHHSPGCSYRLDSLVRFALAQLVLIISREMRASKRKRFSHEYTGILKFLPYASRAAGRAAAGALQPRSGLCSRAAPRRRLTGLRPASAVRPRRSVPAVVTRGQHGHAVASSACVPLGWQVRAVTLCPHSSAGLADAYRRRLRMKEIRLSSKRRRSRCRTARAERALRSR